MVDTLKYQESDLALVVWPRQSYEKVQCGEATLEQVAHGHWAVAAEKAERVRVLIAIYEDLVVGAWAVTGVDNNWTEFVDKNRRVNRATFELADDSRLAYLVGTPSPRPRQRNPQTAVDLRDIPGGEGLIADRLPPSVGTIQIGDFVFTVTETGAEVRMPPGAVITIRPAA